MNADLSLLLQLARRLEIRLRVPVLADLRRGVLLDRIAGQYGIQTVLPTGQLRRIPFCMVIEIAALDGIEDSSVVIRLALARLQATPEGKDLFESEPDTWTPDA